MRLICAIEKRSCKSGRKVRHQMSQHRKGWKKQTSPMPETAILKCLYQKKQQKGYRHAASSLRRFSHSPWRVAFHRDRQGMLTRELLDGLCSMVWGKVELAPPGCLSIYPFCSSSAKIQDCDYEYDYDYEYDCQPKE